MKLINKDSLISGLEDWRNKIKKGITLVPLCGRQRADATHEYEVIGLVKDYIDAFEVKEINLKEEIDKIWKPRFSLGWDDKSLLSISYKGFETFAEHFFELGLKAKD